MLIVIFRQTITTNRTRGWRTLKITRTAAT